MTASATLRIIISTNKDFKALTNAAKEDLCVKPRSYNGSESLETSTGPGGRREVDGHTVKGMPPVELDGIFSVDEALQFIRSLDWALMMDSHEDKPPDHPQRMDYVAHRAFLKSMREKLYKALEEQYPDLLKELGPA